MTAYKQGGPFPEREHQVPLRRQAHRHAHAHPGRAVSASNTDARMCACTVDMLGKVKSSVALDASAHRYSPAALIPQAQPALSTEPAAAPAPNAPSPALIPVAEDGEASEEGQIGAEAAAAAAAAEDEGETGRGGVEQGGGERGDGIERRSLRLGDAEALRAFFLRPSVKQWVLGQYQRSLVREVSWVGEEGVWGGKACLLACLT